MARRIAYVRRARADFRWFRSYYEDYFPEGLSNAEAGILKCVRLLALFPHMGRPTDKSPRRQFSVPRMPFTIVYRENGDVIEILRILDQRSKSYLDDLFENS